MHTPTSVLINPRKALISLITLIFLLALASCVSMTLVAMFQWSPRTFEYNVLKLFWLDAEQNIPTVYQTVALIAAGCLTFLVRSQSATSKPFVRFGWFLLAAGLIFMGLDEGAHIHEMVGHQVESEQAYRWTYVYVPLTMLAGALLVPLLRDLQARTRRLFIISGAMFLAGAVGLEIVAHHWAADRGELDLLYNSLATLEETLEMLGIALYIYALLDLYCRLPLSSPSEETRPTE